MQRSLKVMDTDLSLRKIKSRPDVFVQDNPAYYLEFKGAINPSTDLSDIIQRNVAQYADVEKKTGLRVVLVPFLYTSRFFLKEVPRGNELLKDEVERMFSLYYKDKQAVSFAKRPKVKDDFGVEFEFDHAELAALPTDSYSMLRAADIDRDVLDFCAGFMQTHVVNWFAPPEDSPAVLEEVLNEVPVRYDGERPFDKKKNSEKFGNSQAATQIFDCLPREHVLGFTQADMEMLASKPGHVGEIWRLEAAKSTYVTVFTKIRVTTRLIATLDSKIASPTTSLADKAEFEKMKEAQIALRQKEARALGDKIGVQMKNEGVFSNSELLSEMHSGRLNEKEKASKAKKDELNKIHDRLEMRDYGPLLDRIFSLWNTDRHVEVPSPVGSYGKTGLAEASDKVSEDSMQMLRAVLENRHNRCIEDHQVHFNSIVAAAATPKNGRQIYSGIQTNRSLLVLSGNGGSIKTGGILTFWKVRKDGESAKFWETLKGLIEEGACRWRVIWEDNSAAVLKSHSYRLNKPFCEEYNAFANAWRGMCLASIDNNGDLHRNTLFASTFLNYVRPIVKVAETLVYSIGKLLLGSGTFGKKEVREKMKGIHVRDVRVATIIRNYIVNFSDTVKDVRKRKLETSAYDLNNKEDTIAFLDPFFLSAISGTKSYNTIVFWKNAFLKNDGADPVKVASNHWINENDFEQTYLSSVFCDRDHSGKFNKTTPLEFLKRVFADGKQEKIASHPSVIYSETRRLVRKIKTRLKRDESSFLDDPVIQSGGASKVNMLPCYSIALAMLGGTETCTQEELKKTLFKADDLYRAQLGVYRSIRKDRKKVQAYEEKVRGVDRIAWMTCKSAYKGLHSMTTNEAHMTVVSLMRKVKPGWNPTPIEMYKFMCSIEPHEGIVTHVMKEQIGYDKRIFMVQTLRMLLSVRILDNKFRPFVLGIEEDLITRKGNEKNIRLEKMAKLYSLLGAVLAMSLDATKFGDMYPLDCFRACLRAFREEGELSAEEECFLLYILETLETRYSIMPAEMEQLYRHTFEAETNKEYSKEAEAAIRSFSTQYAALLTEGLQLREKVQGEKVVGKEAFDNLGVRRSCGFVLGALNFAGSLLTDLWLLHVKRIMSGFVTEQPLEVGGHSDDALIMSGFSIPPPKMYRDPDAIAGLMRWWEDRGRVKIGLSEAFKEHYRTHTGDWTVSQGLGLLTSVLCLVVCRFYGQRSSPMKTMMRLGAEVLQEDVDFDGVEPPLGRYCVSIFKKTPITSYKDFMVSAVSRITDLVTQGGTQVLCGAMMLLINQQVTRFFGVKTDKDSYMKPLEIGGLFWALPASMLKFGLSENTYRLHNAGSRVTAKCLRVLSNAEGLFMNRAKEEEKNDTVVEDSNQYSSLSAAPLNFMIMINVHKRTQASLVRLLSSNKKSVENLREKVADFLGEESEIPRDHDTVDAVDPDEAEALAALRISKKFGKAFYRGTGYDGVVSQLLAAYLTFKMSQSYVRMPVEKMLVQALGYWKRDVGCVFSELALELLGATREQFEEFRVCDYSEFLWNETNLDKLMSGEKQSDLGFELFQTIKAEALALHRMSSFGGLRVQPREGKRSFEWIRLKFKDTFSNQVRQPKEILDVVQEVLRVKPSFSEDFSEEAVSRILEDPRLYSVRQVVKNPRKFHILYLLLNLMYKFKHPKKAFLENYESLARNIAYSYVEGVLRVPSSKDDPVAAALKLNYSRDQVLTFWAESASTPVRYSDVYDGTDHTRPVVKMRYLAYWRHKKQEEDNYDDESVDTLDSWVITDSFKVYPVHQSLLTAFQSAIMDKWGWIDNFFFQFCLSKERGEETSQVWSGKNRIGFSAMLGKELYAIEVRRTLEEDQDAFVTDWHYAIYCTTAEIDAVSKGFDFLMRLFVHDSSRRTLEESVSKDSGYTLQTTGVQYILPVESSNSTFDFSLIKPGLTALDRVKTKTGSPLLNNGAELDFWDYDSMVMFRRVTGEPIADETTFEGLDPLDAEDPIGLTTAEQWDDYIARSMAGTPFVRWTKEEREKKIREKKLREGKRNGIFYHAAVELGWTNTERTYMTVSNPRDGPVFTDNGAEENPDADLSRTVTYYGLEVEIEDLVKLGYILVDQAHYPSGVSHGLIMAVRGLMILFQYGCNAEYLVSLKPVPVDDPEGILEEQEEKRPLEILRERLKTYLENRGRIRGGALLKESLQLISFMGFLRKTKEGSAIERQGGAVVSRYRVKWVNEETGAERWGTHPKNKDGTVNEDWAVSYCSRTYSGVKIEDEPSIRSQVLTSSLPPAYKSLLSSKFMRNMYGVNRESEELKTLKQLLGWS